MEYISLNEISSFILFFIIFLWSKSKISDDEYF